MMTIEELRASALYAAGDGVKWLSGAGADKPSYHIYAAEAFELAAQRARKCAAKARSDNDAMAAAAVAPVPLAAE